MCIGFKLHYAPLIINIISFIFAVVYLFSFFLFFLFDTAIYKWIIIFMLLAKYALVNTIWFTQRVECERVRCTWIEAHIKCRCWDECSAKIELFPIINLFGGLNHKTVIKISYSNMHFALVASQAVCAACRLILRDCTFILTVIYCRHACCCCCGDRGWKRRNVCSLTGCCWCYFYLYFTCRTRYTSVFLCCSLLGSLARLLSIRVSVFINPSMQRLSI